jgi:uncharacterized protein (DUF1810 family)
MAMISEDPFDLRRFVAAQEGVYARALAELRAGEKRSHWMWFVFPQLRGLGRSPTAERYGIVSLAEASAYLAHPLLGPRLREATAALLDLPGPPDLHGVFGSPDDMKFRSSMTLFTAAAAEPGGVFDRALDRFCDGRPDPATLQLLDRAQ